MYDTNSSRYITQTTIAMMKSLHSRLALSVCIAVFISGCGGQVEVAAGGEAIAVVALVSQEGGDHMPTPDCAAEGCKGLRIIDANAEAFRYDAIRREALGRKDTAPYF